MGFIKVEMYFSSIPEPTPSTMTALHQFGAEMLKLSRGLESFAPISEPVNDKSVFIGNECSAEPKKHHKANTEWYENI